MIGLQRVEAVHAAAVAQQRQSGGGSGRATRGCRAAAYTSQLSLTASALSVCGLREAGWCIFRTGTRCVALLGQARPLALIVAPPDRAARLLPSQVSLEPKFAKVESSVRL